MDLLNTIYAASLVFILFSIYKIPLQYYVFVISHLFLIFLLNNVLFSPSYLPDQFKYLYTATKIRDSLDFLHYYQYHRTGFGNISNASLLFALFPIPILHSIYSLAIINFILYSILFLFLYIKNVLVGNALWFYLFFPSFALYAGVGLRDIFILFFMVFSVYLLYKKKLILSIIVALPLLFIKSQNFLIYIVALASYAIIKKDPLISIKILFKILMLIILFYALITFIGVQDLNTIRYSLYIEDGGDPLLYIPLVSYTDLIFQGTIGGLYMILKPLPWESTNILQFLQSIENIFIFYFIYRIIREQLKVKNEFINFLIVYFFIAMMIYGLVVFNYGTAARYRFTFELIFILFSWSILYKEKNRQYE